MKNTESPYSQDVVYAELWAQLYESVRIYNIGLVFKYARLIARHKKQYKIKDSLPVINL